MQFTGRTVMLTAPLAGNLGRAVARSFADFGANLVLVDRHWRVSHGIASARNPGRGMGLPSRHQRANRAHATRAVVPAMLKAGGGKIVNIGAYAAHKGAARMGAYVASKSAVIRLTETMATELREHNINVNCVLPTVLDTPENRAAMPEADPKRWVAPQDLAEVIVFLAADAARAIHGAALPVTGLS